MSSGLVGPAVYADGATGQARIGKQGDQIVSELQGRYSESAKRREIFSAVNQTGVTLTVGLTTTYTGFCLINPINSGKNAELLTVGMCESIAATVPGPIGLIVGGSSAGLTAFTAISVALWGSTMSDSLAATNGSVCSVAAAGITLVGAPRYAMWLATVGTVATTSLGLQGGLAWDVAGQIVVGPGGYVAIGSNVAVATGLFGFAWRESAQ